MTVDPASMYKLFATAENLNPNYLTDGDRANLDQKIHRLGNLTFESADDSNPTYMRTLNHEVINASSAVKTKQLNNYKTQDAEKSLKFLELFLIYAFYANRTLHISQESLDNKGNDELIQKTLTSAQAIWNKIDTKKANKKSLQLEVKNLEKKINKVLIRRIQPSEFETFQKAVKKALRVLKNYIGD
ncbi:hypothetical protein BN1013_01485 [Candidatus Rubidus massiliensis]|nr:MAG: hypothetical protein BGO10_04810 [Chlamydia sp. 32-24]CDZ80957.1 hypothetical protein BN1013_01485 [Candidatus Rubidus massiliensis]